VDRATHELALVRWRRVRFLVRAAFLAAALRELLERRRAEVLA
jgi:hypothetical protein